MTELLIEPILALSYIIGVLVVICFSLACEAVSLAVYEYNRIEKAMRINDKIVSKKVGL